jgi:Uncharacterized alpha/beta hydrolase domain (DUF2235)
MKNIVICSDGTGNTAIKGRGTNVFKLFEAVDLNGHRTDPHLAPRSPSTTTESAPRPSSP